MTDMVTWNKSAHRRKYISPVRSALTLYCLALLLVWYTFLIGTKGRTILYLREKRVVSVSSSCMYIHTIALGGLVSQRSGVLGLKFSLNIK